MRVRAELHGHPATRWSRAAVTGHREQFIPREVQPWVCDELQRVAVKLRDEHQTTTALCGLANGSDIWWAQAAESADLEVWAYQPFLSQAARWPHDQQVEHARILERSTRHVLVAERSDTAYFDLRNSLLIGDAEVVVAVRDPAKTNGGTVSALRKYCAGMPVITIDVRRRRTTFSAAYQYRS